MMTSPDTDRIDTVIQQLGDICHEHYLGCAQNKYAPDGYEYAYDNEVINLLDTPEAKAAIEKLLFEARIEEAMYYIGVIAEASANGLGYASTKLFSNRIESLKGLLATQGDK